jgi:hypothetical protein
MFSFELTADFGCVRAKTMVSSFSMIRLIWKALAFWAGDARPPRTEAPARYWRYYLGGVTGPNHEHTHRHCDTAEHRDWVVTAGG